MFIELKLFCSENFIGDLNIFAHFDFVNPYIKPKSLLIKKTMMMMIILIIGMMMMLLMMMIMIMMLLLLLMMIMNNTEKIWSVLPCMISLINYIPTMPILTSRYLKH